MNNPKTPRPHPLFNPWSEHTQASVFVALAGFVRDHNPAFLAWATTQGVVVNSSFDKQLREACKTYELGTDTDIGQIDSSTLALLTNIVEQEHQTRKNIGFSPNDEGDFRELRDWDCHTTNARISAGRGTNLREECVWLNPACANQQLQQCLF